MFVTDKRSYGSLLCVCVLVCVVVVVDVGSDGNLYCL